ncbi:MAG: restriction endonuclease subunit S [Candidatus Methylomirabilis oxygeniifera]|uniref:Putative Restriction modification system DNA specificity domain n=1 Tax=Methylomirabilis oxygeniifera TaxID=671143 RepID=D5MIL8_METO1|nr:MAG: restriction endonuclease subunit S [Candidatus Methylomirabilis oxyfera]CBE69375.1 putative Restriction modification system DNA specificity domain [Candidatus Methylomirabilis oxyfera]
MRTVTKAYRRSRQRSQFLTLERAAQNGSGIPDGWRTVPLRSLCLATELTDPTKSPATSFQYIDVSAVSNDLWKITGSTEHLGTTAPSRARKLVGANDVIFATVRPMLRRIAMIPEYLDGQIVSTAFCVLRANPTQADSRFIYYTLLTDEFIERIGNLQRGASYPAVTDGDILGQEILVPPLAEQHAIAAVLSKIQAAVEVQDKLVAALKELKAATTAKLFCEGLRGEPLKQTEIGEIPESWEVMRLCELASIERGKFTHRPRNEPRFYGGAIPFIQTGDVAKSNGRIRTYSQTLNEEGLAISRLFPKGTIVLTIAANIADTAILEFDSAFPDSLVGITPDGTMDAAFLECYLRTQKADMNHLAPKGTQKNININFLKPWSTPRPSIEEQQEIAHSLRCLDNKLELAWARRDTLKSLFSSMLHLLMTGQVRVSTAIEPIEAVLQAKGNVKP